MPTASGADERAWPPPEDRFASRPPAARTGSATPGCAELTAAAAGAPVPVLLGGHALVGPGRPAAWRWAGAGTGTDERSPGRPAASRSPGYRREALPDPETVGEDEALVAAIRAEIEAGGPITFARFMERALYEPGHGYYRPAGRGPRAARATSSRHPRRTRSSARRSAGCSSRHGTRWAGPTRSRSREPGAGTGALAAGLLGGLRDLGSPLLAAIRYRPVEVEAARGEAFRERLAAEGLAGHVEAGDPPAIPVETGAVVANEVLDALPVHRVVGRADGIRELLVGVTGDGGFEAVEGDPTTPALAERLAAEGVSLSEGQVTEVCLAVDGWLAGAVRHLEAGVVVLVDYAEEPVALHGADRPTGTLRAFARHAVGADPFRHVGRQDLTATVDLAAVRAAAAKAGLTPLGETTQAELLAAVGSAELTGAWLRRPGAGLQDALLLRSALMRLMDTRGMGGFRVLAFGRGLPPGTALPGLARVGRAGSRG